MSTQIFEKIYNQYCDTVYRVAYNYMKNQQDAEDVTQDVFTKFYVWGQDFEDDEHLKSWLIRVTINQCKDKLKSAWFRKIIAVEEETFLELPGQKESSGDLEHSDVKDTVRDAIEGLSNKFSVPLYLHYFEGYSVKEVAELMECKESAIKMRLKKGRDLLKLELEPLFLKEG